ncbi:MAG: histidine kinase dimerization/phospho-acceptor domain-containing protein, partial [Nanoarchaeota archaeon]
FFGTLLIRSVLKEIKTREQMEKLAGELGVANEKLKQLDQAKTEFISIASHQLRSPLTAIKGYSSMIIEGSYGAISEKVKETINKIFVSSNRLVSIIGDFLDVSRIELGKMQYEFTDFDIREMVQNLVEEFKANNRNNYGLIPLFNIPCLA